MSVSTRALMCPRLYTKAKFSTLCKKVCKWVEVVCVSNVKKVHVSEYIFNLKTEMGIIPICLKFIMTNHLSF